MNGVHPIPPPDLDYDADERAAIEAESFEAAVEMHPYSVFRDQQAAREREALQSLKAAKTFKIWTPEEIWRPLEPPDYAVDGLLVIGSLALIVAYGASLKTWVLEDGWISVGTGSQWLGRFNTKLARALIIDFESGDYELRRRAHRLARGREIAIPIDGCSFVTMPEMSLASDDFFAALRPLATQYGFVGIDSLAAGSGGIDENDARFATSLNRLKAIAAETKCVIVLLHHTKKGNGDDTDPREMVRGSSAIFNACDVVLQMVRAKDGGFVVHQTKARGGKAIEPFLVRVDDTGPDASVVVASDVPSDDDQQTENVSRSLERSKRAILLLLGREKDLRSKDAIYRRASGTKSHRVAALKELMEEKLVAVADGAFRLASEVNP